MTRASVKGFALLVVVFVAGAIVGYGLRRPPAASPASGNPMEPHAFVRRLGGELGLDGAQRDSIIAILTRRQATIDSAWRTLRPGVRAAIDSAQQEIVAVLRPDQRPRYEALVHAAHPAMPTR